MKRIAHLSASAKPLLTTTAVVCALLSAGVPATAQAPELAMLNSLERGQWNIRFRLGESKRICVRTGRELIQIMHPRMACNQTVVRDGSSSVEVHYSCSGAGYGQMTIRKETPSLVQISGNGAQGKRPFNVAAEARHTGRCTR